MSGFRNHTIKKCLSYDAFFFYFFFIFLKATFHLTISMCGQSETGKIQRNNCYHGSCGPSLTGKKMSVVLIFKQGTHRMSKIIE